MINITANANRLQTVYNFRRTSENDFYVAVDWEKSPGVRQGGFGATFTQDRLELRGGENNWDVMVAPEGYSNSVFVMAPNNGTRGPGATPPFSRVDLPAPIKAEDSQKTALQVASALCGIPFMETMLSLPIEKA